MNGMRFWFHHSVCALWKIIEFYIRIGKMQLFICVSSIGWFRIAFDGISCWFSLTVCVLVHAVDAAGQPIIHRCVPCRELRCVFKEAIMATPTVESDTAGGLVGACVHADSSQFIYSINRNTQIIRWINNTTWAVNQYWFVNYFCGNLKFAATIKSHRLLYAACRKANDWNGPWHLQYL